MTKDCEVRILGHSDAGEIKSGARYHKKEGTHYVFFERTEEGVTEKYSVKFSEEFLEYKRQGALKTVVCLRPGERTSSKYITPYGEFDIGFYTGSFLVDEKEDKIRVSAEYDMTLNGEPHEKGKIMIELAGR